MLIRDGRQKCVNSGQRLLPLFGSPHTTPIFILLCSAVLYRCLLSTEAPFAPIPQLPGPRQPLQSPQCTLLMFSPKNLLHEHFGCACAHELWKNHASSRISTKPG